MDDGGHWYFDGTGSSTVSDGCTKLADAFGGTGSFAMWDPSVEGTGFVQLTIYNDPGARPRATLAFSLSGHEARTGRVKSGPDCKAFQADSTWPFPTSMSGALLDGAVESQNGTLGVYMGTFAPVTEGDWTTFWYGSLIEVR